MSRDWYIVSARILYPEYRQNPIQAHIKLLGKGPVVVKDELIVLDFHPGKIVLKYDPLSTVVSEIHLGAGYLDPVDQIVKLQWAKSMMDSLRERKVAKVGNSYYALSVETGFCKVSVATWEGKND